jgi:hypothetical protein
MSHDKTKRSGDVEYCWPAGFQEQSVGIVIASVSIVDMMMRASISKHNHNTAIRALLTTYDMYPLVGVNCSRNSYDATFDPTRKRSNLVYQPTLALHR